MDYITYLLNIPLLQALGILLLIGLAERIGIPVISSIKNILNVKKSDGGSQERKDNVNTLQSSIGAAVEAKLDKIAGNDLSHIQTGIDDLKKWQAEENVILARVTFLLEEIRDSLKK